MSLDAVCKYCLQVRQSAPQIEVAVPVNLGKVPPRALVRREWRERIAPALLCQSGTKLVDGAPKGAEAFFLGVKVAHFPPGRVEGR